MAVYDQVYKTSDGRFWQLYFQRKRLEELDVDFKEVLDLFWLMNVPIILFEWFTKTLVRINKQFWIDDVLNSLKIVVSVFNDQLVAQRLILYEVI